MNIAKFIFDNDKKMLSSAEHYLLILCKELANENIFPLMIYRYMEAQSDIGYNLRCLIEMYRAQVGILTTEAVEDFLKINNPVVHFMVSKSNYSPDVYACHLIESDLWSLYPKKEDFIFKDIRKSNLSDVITDLKFDRYGLVKITPDFRLENQYIIYKNMYRIYYHPYLRRYHSVNFTEITAYLREVSQNKNLELSLALDPIRISRTLQVSELIEMDHWFGPKFSIGRMNDPNFKGVTIHTRSTEDPLLDFAYSLIRTEFYISNTKDGMKSIEIEEIIPAKSNKYILHKYVHMLWNKNIEKFVHFDPAVMVYTSEEHNRRVAYKWSSGAEDTKIKCSKIKLFRIDGSLDLELAMKILGDFYRYNELVQEFFGDNIEVQDVKV